MSRVLVALALLLVSVLPAAAQGATEKIPLPSLDCGNLVRENTSAPYGDGRSPWLQYIVETIRDLKAMCIAEVRVDGHVQGVSGSSGTKSERYAASLKRPVALPGWGTYTTESHHWFDWAGREHDFGTKLSSLNVQPRADEEPPPPDDGDPGEEGEEEPEETVSGSDPDSASPLLFDVAHDGYHLTNVDDGVLFDIDGDGALDRIAWTRPDSDDAWLALDRNGNGKIDNGTELFGNHTEAYLGKTGYTTPNGFEALRFTEGPTYGAGVWDEVIDSRDAVFGRLLLWTDRNHNGISEPEELQSVASAGVRAISTDYKEARKRDPHGNEFRQRAKATFSDGAFFVYDVWLRAIRQQ